MIITKEQKQKILTAIEARRTNYKSDAKMAVALGISAAQLSRIKKGKLEGVLSDQNWIIIARRLDVELGKKMAWQTAKTPTYVYMYAQFTECQKNSQSGLLCDRADIGKTYTARCYVKENRNAVYIDCSQVKSKQKLIRQIAREFGLNNTGKYSDVYEDLIFYLRTIEKPIIILDEAGDLDYPAFLELKALWNATELSCGWYMMGADGLKQKIEGNMGRKKVGYEEIFSRFGKRFLRMSPDGKEAWEDFIKAHISLIVKANGNEANIRDIYFKTGGSLRRIPVELSKIQPANEN